MNLPPQMVSRHLHRFQRFMTAPRVREMSARSIANYPGGTTRQRWFRALLRQAMETQGFSVYPDEWWHFDYKDWADYSIGTATYTDLDAGRAH